jgi:hypothetical protein
MRIALLGYDAFGSEEEDKAFEQSGLACQPGGLEAFVGVLRRALVMMRPAQCWSLGCQSIARSGKVKTRTCWRRTSGCKSGLDSRANCSATVSQERVAGAGKEMGAVMRDA